MESTKLGSGRVEEPFLKRLFILTAVYYITNAFKVITFYISLVRIINWCSTDGQSDVVLSPNQSDDGMKGALKFGFFVENQNFWKKNTFWKILKNNVSEWTRIDLFGDGAKMEFEIAILEHVNDRTHMSAQCNHLEWPWTIMNTTKPRVFRCARDPVENYVNHGNDNQIFIPLFWKTPTKKRFYDVIYWWNRWEYFWIKLNDNEWFGIRLTAWKYPVMKYETRI